MTEVRGDKRRITRRGVLGAPAGLGMAVISGSPVVGGSPAVSGSTALAGTRHARGPYSETGRADDEAEAGGVWGVSSSGQGIGVRGNGLAGVRGEGTHTGVAGDGVVGVHGTTSIVDDAHGGVGVWAETEIPGHLALRADGPSVLNGPVEFNGVTTFGRSGVVTVRSGERRVTKTGLELGDATVVLATLQSRAANVHVHAVEVDAAAGSFTIFLTGSPGSDVKIGWLAIG